MSKPEYTHQCRYCAYCVYTIEDTYWCDEKSEDIAAPKCPNRCAAFLFNAIPADNPGGKPYEPRRPKPPDAPQQMRLFDMPTDRQRRAAAEKFARLEGVRT